MIQIDKNRLKHGVNATLLQEVIAKHNNRIPDLEKLKKYYNGENDIQGRKREKGLPNNRISHGYPYYIATVATGYLVGSPVTYSLDGENTAFNTILDAYDSSNIESVDIEIATNASIYGRGIELVYNDENSQARSVSLDPMDSFVVYGDTVDHPALLGVRLFKRIEGGVSRCFADVYSHKDKQQFSGTGWGALEEVASSREGHPFDKMPMIEYWNNGDEKGDFERVLSLIDAYDAVESDRVNDKQQFTDAILVTRGFTGLDDEAEVDEKGNPIEDKRTDTQKLNDQKWLVLPDKESDAQWLVKQLSQGDTEILKDAIKSDIHKFSMVPDLSDEQFSGNSTGVAMRFKLLGLEQLTKSKERWFKEGLYERLRLYANFMGLKGQQALDPNKVELAFTRSLPVNDLEIAQTVQTLSGLVPGELLLGQIPFITDPKKALELLKKEKAEKQKEQLAMFNPYPDRNEEQEG